MIPHLRVTQLRVTTAGLNTYSIRLYVRNGRHMKARSFAGSVVALLALSHSQPAAADISIDHVNVIPMTPGGSVRMDATVEIRGDRIASVGNSNPEQPRAARARRIDGRGLWLIPALADMHVHLENDRLLRLYTRDASIPRGTVNDEKALLPYVANGVLQILVLTAMPETIAQRDE